MRARLVDCAGVCGRLVRRFFAGTERVYCHECVRVDEMRHRFSLDERLPY